MQVFVIIFKSKRTTAKLWDLKILSCRSYLELFPIISADLTYITVIEQLPDENSELSHSDEFVPCGSNLKLQHFVPVPCVGVVKYELSLFFSAALRFVYEHSCVLSNLSYSSNLSLTLMSARMRGAKACAHSYMSRRDSKIKLTAYT